jgi:aryl-alcohol dehydrogenase-like predicted oxidoreductase
LRTSIGANAGPAWRECRWRAVARRLAARPRFDWPPRHHYIVVMKYRQIPGTGVFVSELCLGAMTFGGGDGVWGMIGNLDQKAVDELVHAALDAGINFFDTANVYGFGASETLLGKSLGARRRDVVLATKVRGRMGAGPNQIGLSRVHIMQSVEESLKRLGTDYIDLYQIHGYDPLADFDDIMRTLDDLVRSGKVRYVGASNLAAWHLMKSLGISRHLHLEAFRTIQSYYSLAGRDLEREVIPLLKDQNVGLLVWSPLAGGFISGKFTRNNQDADGRRARFDFPPIDKEKAFRIIDVLAQVGKAHGCSPARVALGWLLAQSAVTSVIIGAKRKDQLDDNLKSVELALSAEEMAKLDQVSALAPEYPGWMFAAQLSDRMPGTKRTVPVRNS